MNKVSCPYCRNGITARLDVVKCGVCGSRIRYCAGCNKVHHVTDMAFNNLCNSCWCSRMLLAKEPMDVRLSGGHAVIDELWVGKARHLLITGTIGKNRRNVWLLNGTSLDGRDEHNIIGTVKLNWEYSEVAK